MTAAEREEIDNSITPDNREDAIRLVNEWTLDRLAGWDEDLRSFILQVLISKVAFYKVEPPSLWYNMAMDPSYYTQLQAQDHGVEEMAAVEFDPLWRPTEDAESEFTG